MNNQLFSDERNCELNGTLALKHMAATIDRLTFTVEKMTQDRLAGVQLNFEVDSMHKEKVSGLENTIDDLKAELRRYKVEREARDREWRQGYEELKQQCAKLAERLKKATPAHSRVRTR